MLYLSKEQVLRDEFETEGQHWLVYYLLPFEGHSTKPEIPITLMMV